MVYNSHSFNAIRLHCRCRLAIPKRYTHWNGIHSGNNTNQAAVSQYLRSKQTLHANCERVTNENLSRLHFCRLDYFHFVVTPREREEIYVVQVCELSRRVQHSLTHPHLLPLSMFLSYIFFQCHFPAYFEIKNSKRTIVSLSIYIRNRMNVHKGRTKWVQIERMNQTFGPLQFHIFSLSLSHFDAFECIDSENFRR